MIKATNNFIILKLPEKDEEISEGGIYLPEEKKDQPQEGIVVDPSNQPLKKGQRVWFKMWAGETIKYEKKEYLIINFRDLIAYEESEVKNV